MPVDRVSSLRAQHSSRAGTRLAATPHCRRKEGQSTRIGEAAPSRRRASCSQRWELSQARSGRCRSPQRSAGLPTLSCRGQGWLPDEQYRLKAFFPILLLLALLGHFGVERPTAAFYGKPPAWLCGGICARVQSYDEEERRARRARVLPDGSLPVSHQLHSQLAV